MPRARVWGHVSWHGTGRGHLARVGGSHAARGKGTGRMHLGWVRLGHATGEGAGGRQLVGVRGDHVAVDGIAGVHLGGVGGNHGSPRHGNWGHWAGVRNHVSWDGIALGHLWVVRSGHVGQGRGRS